MLDEEIQDEDVVSGLAEMLKAKKDGDDAGDDKDGDDDYNESYMKKYMKRYMQGLSDSERSGMMKKMGSVKKAKQAIDDAADAAADDAAGADVTLVDGTEMFKAFKEFGDVMLKAISDITTELEEVKGQLGHGLKLSEAQGHVMIKAARSIDAMSNTPVPPKGRLDAAGTPAVGADAGNGGGSLLEKAKAIGMSKARGLMIKAAVEGKDQDAMSMVTMLESAHGRMELLQPHVQRKIVALHENGGQ